MRWFAIGGAALLALAVAGGMPAARAQSSTPPGADDGGSSGYLGLPGATDPGKPSEANGWTRIPLKIVPVKEWRIRTPKDTDTGDERAAKGNWIHVSGGTLPLTGIAGGPVRFEYFGGKLMLDVDGDGSCETPHLREHFALKALRPDGTQAVYHFRLRRIDKDYVFTRACMAVGKIERTKVAFIDESNNGLFNDQQDDAVVIGKRTAAQLLSAVLNIDNLLYHVHVNQAGTEAFYKPYSGPTGTLDLVRGFKAKSKLTYVMVRQGSVFIDAGRKDTVVPVGRWNLVQGVVGRSISQCATIEPGTMTALEVRVGESTSLSWGMPGKITFSCTKNGNQVNISGGSIAVWGQAGEVYTNFKPEKFIPDLIVRDAKSQRQIYRDECAGNFTKRLPTMSAWEVRLIHKIPFLGPFASEWQ